ncbi:MAG TPA: ATP-binding protein [Candidatus Limnocylindria bacterium]|nr:ATP-binding protein [Candidatus Limnocylindria bacterium]
MAGMRELRGGIWRPLLGTPREQVHKYLLSAGVPWLEDLTNDDPSLTRGFLRHRVLPLLEEGFPGASRRLAQAAQVVGADEDAWADMEESWLVRFARRDPPFVYLLKRPFLAQSLAMRRRLVRRLCAAYGIGVDFTQTTDLLALAAGPEDGEMNLPGGAKAYCAEKALHILPNAIESPHVRWEQPEVLAPDGSLGDGVRVQALDAGIAQGAEMRQWEYGDMITPLGMRGSMPITKYLGGRRVDIPWRRFWPVYARGRDVLWVPGLGISEYAAVRPGTKEIVKLRFRGMLPWDRGAKEGADGTE